MGSLLFLKFMLASGYIASCLDIQSTKLLKTKAKCLLDNDQNLLRLLVFLLFWSDLNEIIWFVFTSYVVSLS